MLALFQITDDGVYPTFVALSLISPRLRDFESDLPFLFLGEGAGG